MFNEKEKEYYSIDFSEEELVTLNKKNTLYALFAFLSFIPFLALLIYPGFGFTKLILEAAYEANIVFVFLSFLIFIALLWNFVMSFSSYKFARVIPKKNAPPGGFKLIPYIGITLGLIMSAVFFVYSAVWFIINLFSAQSFDYTGLIGLLFVSVTVFFSLAEYILSFKSNKSAVLVSENKDDKNDDATIKESDTKLFHSIYGLSEKEDEKKDD